MITLKGKINISSDIAENVIISPVISADNDTKTINIETKNYAISCHATNFHALKTHFYSDDNGFCLIIASRKKIKNTTDRGMDKYAETVYFDSRNTCIDEFQKNYIEFLFVYHNDTKHGIVRADNYGSTRLYYQENKGILYFSNKTESLFEYEQIPKNINIQSIFDYMFFHVLPSPFSMYKDISVLEPGYWFRIANKNLTKERFWQPSYKSSNEYSKDDIHDLFLSAVKNNCEDTGKTGAFLSGGLDSSTVSGLLQKLSNKPVETFSIGFDEQGFDEMEYARIAARHFGTHTNEYYVTAEDVFNAIPIIVDGYSEPFGNSSAVPTYYCAKLAAEKGMSKILAGDGGDELFGGNERYRTQLQLGLYSSLPKPIEKLFSVLMLNPVASNIPLIKKISSYVRQANIPMPERMERYNLLDRVGHEVIFCNNFLDSIDTNHPYQYMSEIYNKVDANSRLNIILGYDLKLTLADNDLPKVSTMCEVAGIEVGFPYFEKELFEFSTSLPDKEKTTISDLRILFRKSMSSFLPAEVLNKSKHGFGLPIGQWIMKDSKLRDFTIDSVKNLEGVVLQKGFTDNYFKKNMSEHEGYYGTLLWICIILSEWMKKNDIRL